MGNTHKAFLIAETRNNTFAMQEALTFIGMDNDSAGHWIRDRMKHPDGELLIEFMGRLCYKSFEVGLNPNVTKIREDSHAYLGNVLKQKHGSVFEHSTVTFALCNVSRIFTHELVRHRAGTAYSQESQRFVRLDDFKLYIPDLTEALYDLCPDNPKTPGGLCTTDHWVQYHQDQFIDMADRIKDTVTKELADYVKSIGLDSEGVSFHTKKLVTSALRRLIPGGVNTNIGITANHRTWRHLIANRTAIGAEVEIQEVFTDIAWQLYDNFPALYQDMLVGNEGTDNKHRFTPELAHRESTRQVITFLNEKI